MNIVVPRLASKWPSFRFPVFLFPFFLKIMATARIGMWLIGARGSVATTSIVGLIGLQKGLVGTVGLVSSLPRFADLDLPDWSDFVVGGHEIRSVPLADEAMRLTGTGRTATPELIAQCTEELRGIDGRIRPGTLYNVGRTITDLADAAVPRGESPRQAVDRLRRDLAEFAAANSLAHVVVVNVASTEPAADRQAIPATWFALEPLLDEPCGEEAGGVGGCPLPASSLYAIAALDAGCSYVNFTPSLGSAPAAIDELAGLRATRHAGCDGKTGETLLKSVLAPMFVKRNLQVMSWVGHNIFGNLDGKVLDDPSNKQAKLSSKDHLLREILGENAQIHTSIEYTQHGHNLRFSHG